MKDYTEMIKMGRQFTQQLYDDAEYQSDQMLRKPQPPLVKEAVSDRRILLPMDFDRLDLNDDIVSVIRGRESHRVYSGESMTLRELSFLLWATQGIKSIRGNNYATLRTVPCGGARHEFETYLMVMNVEGLEPGAYHYLPMLGELEFIADMENIGEQVTLSLCGQGWGAKANVVFYWSIMPYRAEWRYGIYAHRVALIDVGHIGQNLYIACESAGLGTCAIAAFDLNICNRMFRLNEEEEYVIYTSCVGRVTPEDKEKELDFYAFLKE